MTEEEQLPLKCLEDEWALQVVTVESRKMRILSELTKNKACQLQKRQPGLGGGRGGPGGPWMPRVDAKSRCQEEITAPYEKQGRNL